MTNKSYIYIRTHPSYDTYNACKLGQTDNITNREYTYITGEIIRGSYICVYEVENAKNIEKQLQNEFKTCHIYINGGNEFYKKDIIDKILPYFNKNNINYRKLSVNEIDTFIKKTYEQVGGTIKQNNHSTYIHREPQKKPILDVNSKPLLSDTVNKTKFKLKKNILKSHLCFEWNETERIKQNKKQISDNIKKINELNNRLPKQINIDNLILELYKYDFNTFYDFINHKISKKYILHDIINKIYEGYKFNKMDNTKDDIFHIVQLVCNNLILENQNLNEYKQYYNEMTEYFSHYKDELAEAKLNNIKIYDELLEERTAELLAYIVLKLISNNISLNLIIIYHQPDLLKTKLIELNTIFNININIEIDDYNYGNIVIYNINKNYKNININSESDCIIYLNNRIKQKKIYDKTVMLLYNILQSGIENNHINISINEKNINVLTGVKYARSNISPNVSRKKVIKTNFKKNKNIKNNSHPRKFYTFSYAENNYITYKDKQYIVEDNIIYNIKKGIKHKPVGTWNDGKVKKLPKNEAIDV